MPKKETLDELLQRYAAEELAFTDRFKEVAVNTTDAEGETPLHRAARRGVLNDVRLLIEGGADLEAENVVGSTPLFSAVFSGELEVVRLLLEAGANTSFLHQRNDAEKHETPLTLCEAMGRADIRDLLYQYSDNKLVK